MREITNFAEAHQALRAFYGKHAEGPYTLDRMRQLMHYLENPQEKLQIIHVAGTSGKTSTAYFIASLLRESGANVGLTVSPHVDEVNERVQIDLVPLPETEFCQALSEFLELIDRSNILPSYFECMVAFAYWEFARRRVDYAVVEVGLGGLLDGTNVAERADKVCVITDIGLDHTEVLGETLAEIAVQKAGIIQKQNDAFMYWQGDGVMEAVERACKEKQATLRLVPQMSPSKIEHLPLFQERNFCLAEAVVQWLLARDTRSLLQTTQLQKAAEVYIPARMEIVHRGEKTIIIDGSHNAQKLQTLFESVHATFPDQPIAALVGFVEGDVSRLHDGLDELMGSVRHLIATSFYSEKDYPKHSVPVGEIVNYCTMHGWHEVEAQANPAAALQSLLGRPEPLLLVTGSFYLLNHIRPLLFEGQHD